MGVGTGLVVIVAVAVSVAAMLRNSLVSQQYRMKEAWSHRHRLDEYEREPIEQFSRIGRA